MNVYVRMSENDKRAYVHTRNCRRVGARFSWFVGAGRGRPLRCDFGNFVEPGREGLFLVFLSIWVRVGDDIAPAVSSDSLVIVQSVRLRLLCLNKLTQDLKMGRTTLPGSQLL